MTLRSTIVLHSAAGLCIGLALVLSTGAEAAKATKHKRHVGAAATQSQQWAQWNAPYRGTELVRRGPLYNGPDYLGDDPDPNIRFQLLRDLDARYGGGGD